MALETSATVTPNAASPVGINSTDSALGGGATFTGQWEYPITRDLAIYGKADQDGTLYVDFTIDDGSTFTTYPVSGYKISADIPFLRVAVKLQGRGVRVRVVNGSTAQSSFWLRTYFGDFRQLSAPLSQSQTLDTDAIVVRQLPPGLDLDLDGFSDISTDTKHGYVEDIDALDNEVDVWALANDGQTGRVDTKTFPSSSSTFYMASSDSSDTGIEVTVLGLDGDGLETTVVQTLDGTDAQTPVSLGTLLDVNRAYVSGDDETPAGDITIGTSNSFTSGRPTTASESVAFLPVGKNQTQQVQISVPSNRKCRIQRFYASMARASGMAGSGEVEIWVKESGGSWRVRRHYDLTSSIQLDRPQQGFVVGAGSRITVRLTTAVSDTDTNVNAEIDYQFIDV